MENINLLDVSIVIAYLIGCLILGFKKFGHVRTLREYTLGSNPFTTSVLIATTFATSVSAHKVIGNIGKSYQLGVAFAATLFLVPIGWFVMARLLGNNLDFFHQKKFMTLGDIMEHWYGKLGRHITSLASIIITLGVTATGCMAIGKLGHYFFGIPELLCMIIALSVVTIYATFGGFTAVAITDVFQFIIFFIAIPVAFVIGLDEVGGYANILKSLPESHLTMQSKDITLFASLAVFALIPNTTVPFVQRALVARNKSQLVKTFTSTAILMIPLYILVALIGFMTYIKNPNLQTDTVLFYFIKHYLPVGAVGFMIAGLLAVIMSTQDSFLNTTSALIASDICKKIWPSLSVQKELIIARASCVLLAILSIFLLFIKEDILELIWFIANFWDPLVLTPFALALMGVRINKKFFFIIPIITLTSQIITRQIVGSFDTRSLAVGAITAAVSILIASYLHKKRRITWVN